MPILFTAHPACQCSGQIQASGKNLSTLNLPHMDSFRQCLKGLWGVLQPRTSNYIRPVALVTVFIVLSKRSLAPNKDSRFCPSSFKFEGELFCEGPLISYAKSHWTGSHPWTYMIFKFMFPLPKQIPLFLGRRTSLKILHPIVADIIMLIMLGTCGIGFCRECLHWWQQLHQ